MSKEICISSTPHETRLAIVEDDQLTEIYYERENEYTLAGSIYKGRVTRVLPGMQSAFVDVGLERDAFLYVTDFLEEQEDSADFERSPVSRGGEGVSRGPVARSSRREVAAQAEAAEPEVAGTEQTGGAEAAEPPDGTRRWRGRRGRRGRSLRTRSAEATPAGSSPAESASESDASQHGRAASPTRDDRMRSGAQGGAPAEHLRVEPERAVPASSGNFLPGESLSKYGQHAPSLSGGTGSHGREKAAAPVIHSRPSTLVEAPVQWSGSGLLPGESRAETPPAPSPEPALIADEDASASHRVDPAPPSELRIFSRSSRREKHETASEEPSAENPAESSEILPSDPTSEWSEPESSRSASVEPGSSSPKSSNENEFQRHSTEDFDQPDADHAADRFAGLLDGLHSATSEGLLEEEEVTGEEEYEFDRSASGAEEHEFEEMEEETLDSESAPGVQVGELVRETHLEQRVDAESSTPGGDQSAGLEDEGAVESGERSEFAAAAAPQRDHRERRGMRRTDRDARGNGRRGRNGRRQSAQTSDLPIISELLKQGQEILVQIAKEPIAKKGARITSHIALPGRFLVFMPTVNHIGVSRKISSDQERQRLKRILASEKGAGGGGFIVRTAADGASEEELRADIRFLINLWGEIKQREESAKAPALIYHDLNLVERVLRDRVSDNFSAIWVDSEVEYERIVRFLNHFQPSLVRRVKLYTKDTPLFEQFGIQEEIGKALKSKVWLKSGGSIVINQTEALVAIDINTGKYVGKTARLEDTILRTNLDAIPEIVRQIRLRDLGGIIVIDFIDMDERKNRHKVMQALEEALKSDRAPSKVLQFNDFGLVAITRKRVKQSLERTLCVPCETCAGTGMVKGPVTVTNEIYVEMRKMQRTLERRDVLLRVHPEVVKTLKANNGRWLAEIEEMCGKTILVKSDPSLSPEQFDIH